MPEANEVLQVLFAITERARAAADDLKTLAESDPSNAERFEEVRSVMIAQNKLLRITIEALMKYEDQRQELVRRFEERL